MCRHYYRYYLRVVGKQGSVLYLYRYVYTRHINFDIKQREKWKRQNDNLRDKETDRVSERETRWQTGGYKNIFPAFSITVNSVTLPATCKSVVLRQRHYLSVSTADRRFPSHINSGHCCVLSCQSFPRHRPLYFFIYLTPLLKSLISLVGNSFFPSLHLSNSLCLAFNLSLCQSSHVSQLSILYCYFATYFWGHSVSHAVINFPHLPLFSVFLLLCLSTPFPRPPLHPFCSLSLLSRRLGLH